MEEGVEADTWCGRALGSMGMADLKVQQLVNKDHTGSGLVEARIVKALVETIVPGTGGHLSRAEVQRA